MYLEKIKGKMACDAMSEMLLTKFNYNKHIKRIVIIVLRKLCRVFSNIKHKIEDINH